MVKLRPREITSLVPGYPSVIGAPQLWAQSPGSVWLPIQTSPSLLEPEELQELCFKAGALVGLIHACEGRALVTAGGRGCCNHKPFLLVVDTPT